MDCSGHSNQVEDGVTVGEMGEKTCCSGGGQDNRVVKDSVRQMSRAKARW